MKKKNFGMLLAVLLLLLAGCRYSTLDEAIEKTVPYDVQKVVHIEKIKGTAVVLYETTPDPAEFPSIKTTVLGAAFFKGNDQEGWENTGPNGWNHQESESFTVYHEFYREHDEQGKEIKEIRILYGEITNKEIVRIEAAAESGGNKQEADVVDAGHRRYYFVSGNTNQLTAFSKSGEIVAEQKWDSQ